MLLYPTLDDKAVKDGAPGDGAPADSILVVFDEVFEACEGGIPVVGDGFEEVL